MKKVILIITALFASQSVLAWPPYPNKRETPPKFNTEEQKNKAHTKGLKSLIKMRSEYS